MTTPAHRKSGRLTRLLAASASLLLALSGVALASSAADADTPQTIVSLTFDDANADQLAPVLAMNALGLHGTLYTPTGWIDSAGYLTRANLATLYANGNEIGGHTVNHPDLTTESVTDQTQQVCQSRATLAGWGFPQTSFAYPFASVNATTEQVVENCGYNSARGLGDIQSRFGCAGCDYASTLPPDDPYYTEALDEVDSTWTLTDLQNGVINAENHGGGWVQYTFHHICDNVCDSLSVSPALFAQFTQWLAGRAATNNTVVKTVGQVIGGAVKPVVPVTNSMAPAPGPGVNGIINPSLETAGTGGVPSCWTASSFGANSPSFSSVSPGHTGNVAETLNMTAYSNGDAKLLPTMDLGDCAPTVTPGHTYSLRGWYTSSGPTQFEVYLRTDAGGWVYWTASPWLAASPLFSQAVWTTPAIPAGYNGLSFGLTAFQVGTITTDDYELYDSVGTPAPLPTIVAGTPSISGIAKVGATLASSAGTWGPGTVTLAYQWLRNNVAIAGATSASYTLVGADAGQLISLRIIGTETGYNPAWATSGASATIMPGDLTTDVPTISGTAKVGVAATANPGGWGPNTVDFAYQWMLNGIAIAGATSASYTPVGSDSGGTLTVAVTGTELGYTTATTTSAPTLPIARGDLVAPAPTITGDLKVGSTLTAVPGTWGPAGTALSYQWLQDGNPIVGAMSSTYTPVPSDANAVITVAVSGSLLGYTPQTQVSLPAGQVALGTPTVGVPTISGNAAVGQQLTAATGNWGPGTVTFSYQWLRDGVAIGRAINPTYTLGGGDLGTVITVSVTGQQAGYTPGTAVSAATAVIASGTLTTQVPTITGTRRVGATLTAIPGIWGPGTVTLGYQWLRNGSPIVGATSVQYTASASDAGKTLRVRVTGTEFGFTTATTTSAATSTIALGVLTAPTPTITGTRTIGSVLTAVPGTWGPGTVTLGYQWLRNGSPIVGATSSIHKLVTADYRTVISVRVTGTKPGYATVTKTSATIGGFLTALSLPTLSLPADNASASAPSPVAASPDNPAPIIALLLVIVGGAVIGLRFWLRPSSR
jgi:peptidoglycan/xylan/chitin deacetylase (PgdA/CDA1 family)